MVLKKNNIYMVDYIELQSEYNKLCINLKRKDISFYISLYSDDPVNRRIFDILLKLIGNDFQFQDKKILNEILIFLYVRAYVSYNSPNFDKKLWKILQCIS